VWEPLTAETEKQLEKELENLKYAAASRSDETMAGIAIRVGAEITAEHLIARGHWVPVTIRNYWIKNLAIASAAFAAIFSLAMVLPAITRRYWRWLNA
jgi:hypothetical protein